MPAGARSARGGFLAAGWRGAWPGGAVRVERILRTHRYQVTGTGLRPALFLTRLHARFLRTELAELTGQPPPVPGPLRAADPAYRNAIDDLSRQARLAA